MKWTTQHTLAEYYEESYKRHKHTGRSEKTIADFRIALNRFRAFFVAKDRGSEPTIGDLDDDTMVDFLCWITDEEGCAPETANKYAANLKAIWNFAKRKKIVDCEPDFDLLAVPKHARKVWTPAQLEQLLQAARRVEGYVGPVPASIFWPALILTILTTAGRINSVMRIAIGDVDFDRNEILLRHENVKDNADLRKPMLPEAKAAITQLLKHQRLTADATSPLFGCWPYDQNGDYWAILRKHYKRILIDAGLPVERRNLFHCLRAVTVTRITATHGIGAAQAFCDHSSEAVTRAYCDAEQSGFTIALDSVFPEYSRPDREPTPPTSPEPSDEPATAGFVRSLRVFTGDESVA
jgi:integrase